MAKARGPSSTELLIPFPEADHRYTKRLAHIAGDRYLAFSHTHARWIDGDVVSDAFVVDQGGRGVGHMTPIALDAERALLCDMERGVVIHRDRSVKHLEFEPAEDAVLLPVGVDDGHVLRVANTSDRAAFDTLDGARTKLVDARGGCVVAANGAAFVAMLEGTSLAITRHTATDEQRFVLDWAPILDRMQSQPVNWGAVTDGARFVAVHPDSKSVVVVDRAGARRVLAGEGGAGMVALGAEGYFVSGVGLSQRCTAYSFADEPRFSCVPTAQRSYSMHSLGAQVFILDQHGRGEAVQLLDARTGESRFTGALALARTDTVQSVHAVPQGTLLLIRRHRGESKCALLLTHDGALCKLAHAEALSVVPWGDSFATVSHAPGAALSVRRWA